MKQFKRTICIILSVLMLMSAAAVSASAVDTEKAKSGMAMEIVSFDASGWKNVTEIYCHIWKRGGDAAFPWQSKKEKCDNDGTKWVFDLSRLYQSDTMYEGLKDGVDYCVIFSANTGMQTYDATIGRECIGDTLKLTSKKIENPVDSEKRADEAVWTKNSSKYGPHMALSSIGNIVGSKLCPNEKGTEVIGDWLPTYYKSKFVKPVDALAKAFPKFGIKSQKDVDAIFSYIKSKKTGEDEAAMKKILNDAFKKNCKPNTLKVKAVNKTFKAKDLKKKAQSYKAIKVSKANGKISYKVTKKNAKLTFKNGKITVKKKTKKGKYKITVAITASGGGAYLSKTVKKTVTVKVK